MTLDLTHAQGGDFILVHEGGIEAAIIQQTTGGRWNHVAAVSDTCLIEALDNGVVKSDLNKYASADALLVTTPLTAAQRQTAVAFLTVQVGDPYDEADIASFAVNLLTKGQFVLGADGHYICSSLVAAMLKSAGYPVPVDPRRCSPNDLARLFGVAT